MSLQDGVNRKTSDQRSSEVDFSIIFHNNILFNDVMGIFPHFLLYVIELCREDRCD